MRFAFFLLLCVLISGMVSAQSDITPSVSAALKKGDARSIAMHFMPQVELTIPGNDGMFDKTRAEQLLAGFFNQNPPQAFSLKHRGTSKLDDQFRIGELTSAKGMFRVTFFM